MSSIYMYMEWLDTTVTMLCMFTLTAFSLSLFLTLADNPVDDLLR